MLNNFSNSCIVPNNLIEARMTNINDYNYYKLKEKGILDSSISLKKWIELNQKNKEDEKKILSEKVSFRGKFIPKAGDIIITDATSSWGLTGHSAIFLDSKTVYHIAGSGCKTSKVSWSKFYTDYVKKKPKNTWLKVYRSKNKPIGTKAVKWIKKQSNYGTHKYGYGFTLNLAQKNPTYCSKIPWQAYYYDNKKAVNVPSANISLPYGIPGYFKSAYKVSVVKTYKGEGKK